MRFAVLVMSLALCACGSDGGSPSPQTATVAKSAIERSLGANLDKPVFQCGSQTDTLTADAAPGTVASFESGPVRPLALSADGQRLYVTNTPSHCLEIYAIDGDTLRLASTVSVGLEPVAVAERNANEVWVVNHMSDSVSVVRLDGTPRVLRTLLVGDEPRDIVFAGPGRDRAFITAAARGQNKPGFSSEYLSTPGVGRADVWVFDAAGLGDGLNGNPLAIVNLLTEVPRALAVSPDGASVYAAAFHSGNRTTTLHRDSLFQTVGNASTPFLKPASPSSMDGQAAQRTGLIVRNDGSRWLDETRRDWSDRVKFSMSDKDVFVIDAMAPTPLPTASFSGVGTTLFNMAVSPANGRLFVSNTEAFNDIRFEGSGVRSSGSTVRGRIAESRITLIDAAGSGVTPVHLNRHLDFALQGVSVAATDRAKTLAQPMAMVPSPGGDLLYVAAFGSAKVAALPVVGLGPNFLGDPTNFIEVPAGPAGLAIAADGKRLYVYSHIAHAISVVDTAAKAVLSSKALFSPESVAMRDGRQFLYDAKLSSANGSVSCASCHMFGDMDHLAWDLGNPDESTATNRNAYVPKSLFVKTTFSFHPVKGPMSTQTLRGMRGNGPLHWRGDRMGDVRASVNGQLEPLEDAAFKEFNDSFVSLLGRETPLTSGQMQSFTNFAMRLSMPPNPVRRLDNTLSADEAAGEAIYHQKKDVTGLGSCNDCHTLDAARGKFGTAGLMTFEGGRVTGDFKIPQLRNMYQKVGMFGFSADVSAANAGSQLRGFGFGNDGSIDTLENFFSDPVFVFNNPAVDRKKVSAFVLAFDSDFAPVVGQQVTWRPGASAETETRLALLKQQALVTVPRRACDLQARGAVEGGAFSGLLQANGSWLLRGGVSKSEAALLQLATANQPITFTCLPPGTGSRTALNQ